MRYVNDSELAEIFQRARKLDLGDGSTPPPTPSNEDFQAVLDDVQTLMDEDVDDEETVEMLSNIRACLIWYGDTIARLYALVEKQP